MKIRTGFVSNSSSSSFIVSYDPTRFESLDAAVNAAFTIRTKNELIKKINQEIIDMLSREYSFNTVTAEHIMKDWGYDSLEEMAKECYSYGDLVKLEKAGWRSFKGDISSDDDSPLSRYLYGTGLYEVAIPGFRLMCEG